MIQFSLNFRWGRLACALALAGALAACASVPPSPGNIENPGQPTRAVELSEVPFFAQQDFYCGPSALAMVLNHQGQKTNPESIAELVYLPGRQGSLQLEMLAAPRRLGVLSYQIDPTETALQEALQAGSPVVVLKNLSLQIAPQWHYAVVVGYLPDTEQYILRSGTNERELLARSTFLRMWQRAENWGVTVLTTDKAPPSYAKAQNYLNSAVALERSSPAKAAQAYEQGAKRWPTEAWFHFGLANSLYQANNFTEAERSYQRAVATLPEFADAWNNLAETLLQLKRNNEARAAINKAIALGGERLPVYEQTAQRIGETR